MEPLKAIITRTQILGPTDAVFQMQVLVTLIFL
jgi:hypothetical protein